MNTKSNKPAAPAETTEVMREVPECCEACLCFKKDNPQDQHGLCKAHPPTPVPMQGKGLDNQVHVVINSFWPPVTGEGWCADFIPLEEGETKH